MAPVDASRLGDAKSPPRESQMAKDELTKPIDGPDAEPPAGDAEDTEGHSLGLLIGLNAMGHATDASVRARSKRVPEEELAPRTKKAPSMRDGKKA